MSMCGTSFAPYKSLIQQVWLIVPIEAGFVPMVDVGKQGVCVARIFGNPLA